MDRAAYYLALDGVTRHGLSEAVKTILKGSLGHAFFPSPPELRMQCERAMEHHREMRNRIARQERLERERLQARREPTTEEKARVRALLERAKAEMPRSDEKREFDWSKVHERFDRMDEGE